MSRKLSVYLNAELVGQLEQNKFGALSFVYDKAWLASKTAVAISHSLPLRSERFRAKECRPFFAGLLPEEDSRLLIAKGFGVSDKNDFAILEKIGAECAGAISLLPIGEEPIVGTPRYNPVTLAELAAKFAELPRHPLLTGRDGVRLSLAGAQGKLVVFVDDGSFSMAIDGSPSSHILKPQSSHFGGLVENEFFCMCLAARVGLDVAPVQIGDADGTHFLQVERFDRRRQPDGVLLRIHQEDFCQALGIPPELKYQQEGGPSLKRCFELVRAVSSLPGPDVLKLFDTVVFNYLIGNGDAHGKNFSFLYDGGHAKLSPIYDLVCTQAYPDLSPDMAMKIGDERKPARISARNWQKFFKEAGVGQAAAHRRSLNIVARVKEQAQMMAEQKAGGADVVTPIVLTNCHTITRQISKGE